MKILNMTEPVIRCYPHHANYISALMDNEFAFDELLTYYVQLVFRKDINRMDFNIGMDILNYIKNYPYVDSYCYNRDVVSKKWVKNSYFVEEMVNQNSYVHMLVDAYYIPAYKIWYKRIHRLHNITIYGYDNMHFYVADCFNRGKYTFDKILKQELDEATIKNGDYDWLDGIHCWHFKEGIYLGINIDVKLLKHNLNNYILGKRTQALSEIEMGRRANGIYYYGTKIYDVICQYVSQADDYIDDKIPYIFVEHKRLLKYVCDRLKVQCKINNYQLHVEHIKDLEKRGIIIQNLFLKYNNKNSVDIKDRIIEQLVKMKEIEIEYLRELCEDIENNSIYCIHNKSISMGNLSANEDTFFGGNWSKKYGTKGYMIVGDKNNITCDNDIKYIDCYYVAIIRNGGDERALKRVDTDGRVVSYLLNSKQFRVEVCTKSEIKITLYIVDYDRLGRSESILVHEKDSGNLLINYKVSEFEEGKYISFVVKKDVVITVKKICGPDAVLSGVFFD